MRLLKLHAWRTVTVWFKRLLHPVNRNAARFTTNWTDGAEFFMEIQQWFSFSTNSRPCGTRRFKGPQPVPLRSHINTTHNLLKIHLNIILMSVSRSSELSLPSMLSDQNFVSSCYFPMAHPSNPLCSCYKLPHIFSFLVYSSQPTAPKNLHPVYFPKIKDSHIPHP